ncbi:MAG: acyl-protein synthetase [Elusimicrobia bacterium]|nr:acyl-protein synthetase [Elusimicrobiota bacterium]
MKADELLDLACFEAPAAQKIPLLRDALAEESRHHYDHNDFYRRLCDKNEFDPKQGLGKLDHLPFLPVGFFKKERLLSVPEKDIIITLKSSATTSGASSMVAIDKITSQRQAKAVIKIISEFIGKERRPFIFLDDPRIAGSREEGLTARGAAIRGLAWAATESHYVMRYQNDPYDVMIDFPLLDNAIESASKSNAPIAFYGFTFIIYSRVLEALEKAGRRFCLPQAHLIHSGGWKKLASLNISKDAFNERVERFLGIPKNRVIDFYGLVEQTGTIYPDCEAGMKHSPVFSEIIIRDIQRLESSPNGKEGFIQLVSPLAHSYPGISVITDDLGVILGRDNCSCGRKGTIFQFRGRASAAEVRGCGDVMAARVGA